MKWFPDTQTVYPIQSHSFYHSSAAIKQNLISEFPNRRAALIGVVKQVLSNQKICRIPPQ